jgi:lipopolysaccharide/colanic/teichoic acid biosynthesis glycosyltransferase
VTTTEAAGRPVDITASAPAGGLRSARANRAGLYPRVVKPVADRLMAAVLLLLTLPVFLLCMLAVAASMGRPVLFRQQRIGLRGEPFEVLKFRTMRPDRRQKEAQIEHPCRRVYHKSTADPRHTPVGRFLRKWSLDELPQLLNVVRGDMSIIGPRPELPQVVAGYQPWQHDRHEVRPGITGLWQVSVRGEGYMHEWVHIDVEYVRSLSLRTDMKILAKTLPAALGRRTGH